MKIVARIKNLLLYPGAYFYFTIQSHFNWMKSLFEKNNVVFENAYNGQKILLLALYEKGKIREDIKHLLEVAKQQDAYIICVNTLMLTKPDQYSDLMDCYIERYNYGRDFGSYKTGFMYLYKRQLHDKCQRLVILNDSLFYSKKNQATFVNDLFKTDIEALGATENHEIEHHLGSFCLSLAGSVIRNNKFIRYWKKYSNSDVRPVVIKRGEMGLSKTMRRCVSSQDNFTSLYDISWFSEYIKNNPDIVNVAVNFNRASDLVDWKVPNLKRVKKRLISKYFIHDISLAGMETKIIADLKEDTFAYFADSPALILKAFEGSLNNNGLSTLKSRVYEEVTNDMLECFSLGSQIHQNGIFLHHLGMPIIKLDALFRGMYSAEDVEKLSRQLESDEAIQFKRLLYSKPFGGAVLFGWKRAAFYRGLM